MKRFSTAWTIVFLMVAGTSGLAGQSVELISKADPLPDSNGRPGRLSLSADGRYAAFISEAPNLAPGQVDDNFFFDVFLHDRLTDTTTLVSHAAGSPNRAGRPDLEIGYLSLDLQISADGRYVAFVSLATDLVQGVTDTNQLTDVYLWDRVTGTTTLVSHAAGSPNVPADGLSYDVRLSADGRYLAFNSVASNVVEGQTDPEQSSGSVFLWDRATNSSTLVSRKSGTNATEPDNDDSYIAGISADGESVLFMSTAQDLLPNVTDTPGTTDVFLYQRSSGTVTLVSRASGAPGTAAGGYAGALSADGLYVAFVSAAANLVPGQVDSNNSLDAFLFDRISREIRLVSRTSLSPQMAGGEVRASFSTDLAISADGRFVAFASQAANLVPGQVDTNQSPDLFVYDRLTGMTALASHTAGSAATAGTARSHRPCFSADGRFLAFASPATDLVPNQTDANAVDDVFLYDTSTQASILVSHAGGSAFTAANGESTSPSISADGGVVGLFSRANNLGEGQADPNAFYDLFLYRRSSGEITSPSRRDPGSPAVTPHGPSVVESVSADGRYTLFSSRATGLVPGQIDEPDRFDFFTQPTGTWDVFLRDQTAGKNTLLSRSLTSKVTAVGGFLPVLSPDGRLAAFVTSRSTPTFGFRTDRLYLYDRVADTLTLVTHKPGSAEESGGFISFGMSISTDGRFLTYACTACELVPGYFRDPNGVTFTDVYLYDRTTGTNTLVSHVPGSASTGGDHSSTFSRISADGRFVVFASEATNLVPGQVDTSFPLSYDLFVFNRMTGAVTLASRTVASAVTAAGIIRPGLGLSADGRFIAFHSSATNLVPGQVDTDEGTDLFLHDRVSGATVLVSHAASSPVTAGNGPTSLLSSFLAPQDSMISMSADGRFLVYESAAADLVAGAADTDTSSDVFLYDRLSGTNTLVSHALGAGQQAQYPRISTDGSRIAFLGVDSVVTHRRNVYVHERSTGKTTLVAPGGEFFYGSPASALPVSPQVSANGRRIAFATDSPLVSGDFNALADAYLWSDGFFTLPNCKLLDTRRRADRPVLTSNVQRTVTVRGACGVPATAKQVVVNVTVVNPSGKGNLRFYPGAVTATPSGILRFERGATRIETFTLPLSTNGTLTILPFVVSRGTVHGVVEVTGYQ